MMFLSAQDPAAPDRSGFNRLLLDESNQAVRPDLWFFFNFRTIIRSQGTPPCFRNPHLPESTPLIKTIGSLDGRANFSDRSSPGD